MTRIVEPRCPTCGGHGVVPIQFPLFTRCPRCGIEPLTEADRERLQQARKKEDK